MARRPGMKQIPLSRVEVILAQERRDQTDIYASPRRWRIEVADGLAPLAERFRLTVNEGSKEIPLRFTPTSVRQTCEMAGIPAGFLEKVPASLGLKLLRCLLEIRSRADDRPMLMRLKGKGRPKLRAVLPQSYVRLDDLQVLQELRRAMPGEDLEAWTVTVDDDIFFLRLGVGQRMNLGTSRHPDSAIAGMDLIASETGCHPLELRHVVVRLVCTNGMTLLSNGQKFLKTRYTSLDRDVFRTAVQATLESAGLRAGEMARRLAETRSTYLQDPRAEIESIFHRFRLGSPKGKIGRWVIEDVIKGLSLFGVLKFDLIQAFTAVARGLEHRDRMRIEDAMGAYLMGAGGRTGSEEAA